jgi:hypothetical protein
MEGHSKAQSAGWILGATILVLITGALAGCQGLPKNVADCPSMPTPPANTSIVPPATEPLPAAFCGFPLSISSPAKGANVKSPVPILATATPPDPIYTVRLYVDGFAVLYTPDTIINQLIWMPNGKHAVEIVAEDTAGYIATTSMQVNVIGQEPGALNKQNDSDWVSCSALIAGSTCAAGLGVAASNLTLHQSTPSLDGSAAEFTLGGGDSISHFTYDLYFYVNNGNAPQSLEFVVNQAFGGTRWTWGTQCDVDQTHEWNIWDPLHEIWVPIPVPCHHFPSNTWIHLVWRLERVGNQVHYISVSVADRSYPVDVYYTAQPNWYQEEIDIAFQMDGNYKKESYDVGLMK